MNKTNIEWVKNPDGTLGWTWNPITGCLNGCEYCYARKLANTRLRERYLANPNIAPPIVKYQGSGEGFSGEDIMADVGSLMDAKAVAYSDPFYPRFWEDRYLDFTTKRIRHHMRERRGIFVCDMSDLFGIGIPEKWTEKVLDAFKYHRNDRFYLLTKQPQNLIKFSPFPDNCRVGVTITGSDMAHNAIKYLAEIEVKVKYLSVEPLLSHIGLKHLDNTGISWVIIGSCTGTYSELWHLVNSLYSDEEERNFVKAMRIVEISKTRCALMPKIEWVQGIVQACDKAGIPVFLKDNVNCCEISDYPSLLDKSGNLRQELPK